MKLNAHHPLFWRFGGPQGSGVDKVAGLFARACLLAGFNVLGRREYHSNIIGRHSYYDVAFAQGIVHSVAERVDMLVAFEPETVFRHLLAVRPGGFIVYAAADEDTPLTRLPFLDRRLREQLAERFGADVTVSQAIAAARTGGVHCVAVRYDELIRQLAATLGIKPKKAARALNTLAVSVSAAGLGLPAAIVTRAAEQTFADKNDTIEMNRRAVELAYAFAHDCVELAWLPLTIPGEPQGERPVFLNATQSVALGKLAAGLGVQTYYPISPATDESSFLEANPTVPTHDGGELSPQVVQTEDEIAALTMAAGAALTGARSATSTSGPGFSLMAEGLGWAGMNEVPLVVTLYQRGGPSTGMATRTEQGDLQFAIHAGHGEFPRIVFASGDVEECFYDAMQAFNYAERYQLPVIHLLDKALTSTFQNLAPFEPQRIAIERGRLCLETPGGGRGHRFELTADGISPRLLLGRPGCQHWLTGVEHDESGLVTEDPVLRERMMEKRACKLALVAEQLSWQEKLRLYGEADAGLTILTWGSNKGAVLDAVRRLAEEGVPARTVVVRLLHPFPAAELAELLESAEPLVVVEGNYSGQFGALLREHTGHVADHQVVKYSGRPVTGDALHPVLMAIARGEGEPRHVLRNPLE